MRRRLCRPRRRDPGYAAQAELAAALAPFSRPPAKTPLDLPEAFTVLAFSHGPLRYHRMSFVPSARGKLLNHLHPFSNPLDELFEWLELELRWAFYEELGYAARYTQPQLLTALRALARLDPTTPPPALPPAFLDAVKANERFPAMERYLPEDLEPIAYDDNLEPLLLWSDLGAEELTRRADALYLAIRRRPPDNWELLARRAQWEPLRQGAIEICVRLWVEVLKCPGAAGKPLIAFTLELLALVDPTFPRSPDEALVESIRTRLAKALKKIRRR